MQYCVCCNLIFVNKFSLEKSSQSKFFKEICRNFLSLKYLLSLLLVLSGLTLAAQHNNGVLSDTTNFNYLSKNSVGIHINYFGYMRNTEYFNPIEAGRTLLGNQIVPSLIFKASDNVILRSGIFINHYFGSTKISGIMPLVSLIYPLKNSYFMFGTINGATAHCMVEPLMNISSAIEKRLEYGGQYQYSTSKLFADIWLNWQNYMPYKGEKHEEIVAGLNINKGFYLFEKLKVNLPVQMIINHEGGQLSKDKSPQFTVFSGAAGISGSFIFNTDFNTSLNYYYCFSSNETNDVKNGYAHYSNLTLNFKDLSFIISYFNGQDFNAMSGTYIYQSVSHDKKNFYLENRELLFARLLFNKRISDNLQISLRFEPYYDFSQEVFEHCYSLYLKYIWKNAFLTKK